MNNKRGSTLSVEEVVKLVLGIMALVILMLLFVALLNIFIAHTKQQQAKSTIENIQYEVNRANEGETKEILVESPEDWILLFEGNRICSCDFTGKEVPTRDIFFNAMKNCKKIEELCITFDRPVTTTDWCGWVDTKGLASETLNRALGLFTLALSMYKGENLFAEQGWAIAPNCVQIDHAPVSLYFKKTKDSIIFSEREDLSPSTINNIFNYIKK